MKLASRTSTNIIFLLRLLILWLNRSTNLHYRALSRPQNGNENIAVVSLSKVVKIKLGNRRTSKGIYENTTKGNIVQRISCVFVTLEWSLVWKAGMIMSNMPRVCTLQIPQVSVYTLIGTQTAAWWALAQWRWGVTYVWRIRACTRGGVTWSDTCQGIWQDGGLCINTRRGVPQLQIQFACQRINHST